MKSEHAQPENRRATATAKAKAGSEPKPATATTGRTAASRRIIPPSRRAVAGACVFAALFAALLCCVATGAPWLVALDESVGQTIAAARAPLASVIAAGLALIGGVRGTIVVGVVFLVVLFALRLRASALFLLCTVVAGTLLRYALVYAVGRARPEGLLLDPSLAESSPSFPSGHTFTATLLYLSFALVILVFVARKGRHLWVGRLIGILAVLMTIAMAYSRLYLGVHYLSDVCGGLLLAGAFLVLTSDIYLRNVENWEE